MNERSDGPSAFLSPRATSALVDAGWTPSRRVDVTGIMADLGAKGFACDAAVDELLSSMAGLVVRWGEHESDWVEFNPHEALGDGDRRDVAEFGARSGEALCPIGIALGHHARLYASSTGAVYLAFYPELHRLGDNIWSALTELMRSDGPRGVVIPE